MTGPLLLVVGGAALVLAALLADPRGETAWWAAVCLVGCALLVLAVAL